MKTLKNKGKNRPELVSTIVNAYMELFVTMQFNAVSHWLMLELTFAQARALIILAVRSSSLKIASLILGACAVIWFYLLMWQSQRKEESPVGFSYRTLA